MAERLAYIEAVVGADITQFRKAMRDVRNDVGILSETIGGLGKLGRTATFAISAPLATLGSYAVQASSEFDGAMRNINSIAQVSEAQLGALTQSVLEFGSTTRGGVVESANSLYTVFSAGITDTALAMDTMKVASMTAEAGLADMETTTEALVASMLSYGTETMSATRASDALTAMVQVGVGSMQNFANAVGNVLPSSSALKISIEDTYGAMAFMTQRGLSASKASTSLNSALTALVKPTDAMKASFRSLGVDGAEQLVAKYKTLDEIMRALISTTDGTSAGLAELFANVRGKRFADLVASDLEGYKSSMTEFYSLLDGATLKAHGEQMKSFSAVWDLMTSAMEGASIVIGNTLLPVIRPIIEGITELFLGITKLNPVILELGVQFAGLLTIAPPLIWLFASLLNPIGLLLAGISGLGIAFVNEFKSIEGAIDGVFGSIPEIRSIYDEFDTLFNGTPPDPSTLLPDPVTIKAHDLFQIGAGESAWTVFEESGARANGADWTEWHTEFKRLNSGNMLHPDDFVKVPYTDMSQEVGSKINITQGGLDREFEKYQDKLNVDKLVDMVGGQMALEGGGTELPFETQIGMAFKRVQRKLPTALAEGASAIASWADENISLGMDAISSLFTGEFDTNALSNGLASAFSFSFDSVFPNISTSLAGLVDNIGNWLLVVGLPTLAKGIGVFVGEVGAIIGQGLGLVGNFINDGGVQDAGNGLGESVIDPFMEGFGESMDANGIDGGLDTLLTGIAGALGTYAIANFLIFGGAVASIQKAIGLAMEVATPIASMASSIGGVISRALMGTAVAQSIMSGAMGLAGTVKFGIWYALATALIAIRGSALIQGLSLWATGVMSAIGGALSTAMATATAVGGAIASALVLAAPLILGIAVGLAVDFFLPESAKQGLRDTLGEGIAIAMNEEGGWDQVMRDFEDGVYRTLGMEDMMSKPIYYDADFIAKIEHLDLDTANLMSKLDASVAEELAHTVSTNPDWSVEKLAIAVKDYALEMGMTPAEVHMPHAPIEIQEQFNLIATSWGVGVQGEPTTIEDLPTIIDDTPLIPTGTGTKAIETLQAEVQSATNTTIPTMVRVYDTEAMMADAEATAIGVNGAMMTKIAEGLASGDLTVESFKADFLDPFVENWNATFGAESAVQQATTSFSANFTTSVAEINTQALVMTNFVIGQNARLVGNIQNASNIIVGAMKKARGEIDMMLKAIGKLASISTNLQIKVEVSGEINSPDGSHASGLTRVPFDGYIAEVHKDEAILTAREADQWRTGSVPQSTLTSSSGSATTYDNSNTQVNFYGIEDVDGILTELERRGVYL